MNLENSIIVNFKNNIKNEKVGKTGYMYVMNSKGDLIVHPKKEGENIFQHQFIQDICKMKTGFMNYLWEGREKIVAFTYFPKNDWIIASGSYYEDFNSESKMILMTLIIIISFILSLIIFFIRRFTKSTINPLISIATTINNSSDQIEGEASEVFIWDLDKTYLDTKFETLKGLYQTALKIDKKNIKIR